MAKIEICKLIKLIELLLTQIEISRLIKQIKCGCNKSNFVHLCESTRRKVDCKQKSLKLDGSNYFAVNKANLSTNDKFCV